MTTKLLTGTLLDEQVVWTLADVCDACSTQSEWIVELVAEGILEPSGGEPNDWLFTGTGLTRAQAARRLQSDLEINLAGVALALDLMEEIEALRSRLRSK
jgi:chaperone modulatory protein CbpM